MYTARSAISMAYQRQINYFVSFSTQFFMYAKCIFILIDSSQEYTDSTGIDVHEFLVNTLKNNPR